MSERTVPRSRMDVSCYVRSLGKFASDRKSSTTNEERVRLPKDHPTRTNAQLQKTAATSSNRLLRATSLAAKCGKNRSLQFRHNRVFFLYCALQGTVKCTAYCMYCRYARCVEADDLECTHKYCREGGRYQNEKESDAVATVSSASALSSCRSSTCCPRFALLSLYLE